MVACAADWMVSSQSRRLIPASSAAAASRCAHAVDRSAGVRAETVRNAAQCAPWCPTPSRRSDIRRAEEDNASSVSSSTSCPFRSRARMSRWSVVTSRRAVAFASLAGVNRMCTARVRTICSASPVSSGASHSPSTSRTSRASTGSCAVRCTQLAAGSSQSGSIGSGYSAVTWVWVRSSCDGNQQSCGGDVGGAVDGPVRVLQVPQHRAPVAARSAAAPAGTGRRPAGAARPRSPR